MITPPDSAPERPGQMPASSWNIQAPYDAGTPSPILAHGDADAGGRDDVAGDAAGAQAAAEARYGEHEADTHGAGGVIGDLMAIPPDLPLDPGVGSLGEATPTGAYFDPPRDY